MESLGFLPIPRIPVTTVHHHNLHLFCRVTFNWPLLAGWENPPATLDISGSSGCGGNSMVAVVPETWHFSFGSWSFLEMWKKNRRKIPGKKHKCWKTLKAIPKLFGYVSHWKKNWVLASFSPPLLTEFASVHNIMTVSNTPYIPFYCLLNNGDRDHAFLRTFLSEYLICVYVYIYIRIMRWANYNPYKL